MDRNKILSLLGGVTDKGTEELEKLPENTPLADIGLDSLKFIQFIVAVEEEFGFEVRDSDLLLQNFETIEKLFETLKKYFVSDMVIKKVLICDCDNVLWRGVSGEEEICIDEIRLSFQNDLVQLFNSGILLCLCSMNTRENIDMAFEVLSMPLKKEHIIFEKINFTDKASNIPEISAELNLTPDSFVFIDDSDYEIGLVNALLPEVETVKVDFDNPDFRDRVMGFFQNQSTQELNRTQLYREQKEREKSKLRYASAKEYNSSLQTNVVCETVGIEQTVRLAELSQRTNQFNLSGARYSQSDIKILINSDDHTVLYLYVTDKYGDMGIVGAAVVKLNVQKAVIESFFLSCRVFSRDFEQIMLDKIKKRFADYELYGVYTPTEKNRRFQNFYQGNGVKLYE